MVIEQVGYEQVGDESPQPIAKKPVYDSIDSNQDTAKLEDSKGFTKFNLSIQC